MNNLKSMCVGLRTGTGQSLHIQVSPLGVAMTSISLPPSFLTGPMGNGTVEHRNAGTTLNLGLHLSQAKAVLAIGITWGFYHLWMWQLKHSRMSHQIMPTLWVYHLSLSFRHSYSPSTSLTPFVRLKLPCLKPQEVAHLSCGLGATCTLSLMVKTMKNG